MDERPQVIGRAKMLLVSGSGKAVISQIVVRRIKQQAGGKRLRFGGNVKFSEPLQEHMENIILPIIDRIVDKLGLDRKNFEISALNLGAASARDVGIDVSGMSADLPIILAMLSSALQIPISSDFVATGHIASADGDISAVEGIPAKVEAAQNDGAIKIFLYPDIENDESLKVLSPNQMDSSREAITAARDHLRTKSVKDIGPLVRLVFTEESIVLASLKEGFFDISMIPDKFNNPIQDVISFLACNQERFWKVMYYLFNEEPEKGKVLLWAFAQFYIDRSEYPRGFGAALLQLMRSLSSVTRCRIDLPILDMNLGNKLILHAKESDYDDRRMLLNTIDGKNIKDACPVNTQPESKLPALAGGESGKSLSASSPVLPTPPEITNSYAFQLSDSDCTVFNTVVSLINEQALARKFRAIDSARACFFLESLKVKSYEELVNILQAYYLHLQRHAGSRPEKPDVSEARCEAIKLLESTFRDQGGDKAAFVQARDCTQGGIRSILDMVTEQYKAQKQEAYINRVFKDAIADMEWQDRVKCMQAVIKEVGRFLPEELKNQPPERFARSDDTIETIIRTYVRCSDKFNQSLSRM